MSSPTPTPAPAKPRRRWRRRLLWCAAILVALRLLLPLAISPVLDAVLAGSGLRAEYASLSLSLLGGECEVHDLVVRSTQAEAGAPPLLHVGRLYADLDTTALLTGELVLRQVELVSTQANLRRDAGGRFVEFAKDEAAAPETPHPETPVVEPGPICFSLPLRVISLRVHDLRVHLEDAGLPAPHTIDAEADVTVRNLGDAKEPADLLLHLQVPQCLDALRIEGRLFGHERQLAAELRVDVRGLQPAPIEPWLAAAGLAPAAPYVTAEANVHVRAEPHAGDELAAALRASVDTRVLARDELVAEVRHASLVLDHLTPTGVGHAQIALDGVSLVAQRDEAGQVKVLGFRLVPAATTSASAPAAPAEAAAAPGAPFAISADVRDVNLLWRDAMRGMPTELEIGIADADCSRLAIPLGAEPATIHVALRLPGVVDRLELRDVKMQRNDTGTSLGGALRGNGITLQRLRPLLDAVGLESTFTRAELQADFAARWQPSTGGVRADAELRDVRLRNGERAVELAGVRVRGLELGTDGGVHVGAVECEGPVVALQKRADGTIELPGMRLHAAPARAATPVEASASKHSPAKPGPRVCVEHFAWNGMQVTFTDESTEPAVQLAVSAQLTADHLVVAGARADESPGAISLTLGAPGLATATARGQVVLGPELVRAELELDAKSVTLAAIRPWLAAARIEPLLGDGTLRARLAATAALSSASPRVDVDVSEVSLRDGETELFSLGRARVVGLATTAEELTIDGIGIDRPLMTAARDADGVLHAAGLRFAPRAGASAAAPADASAPEAPSSRLSIGEVKVENGALLWRDDARATPVTCRADFALQAQRLTVGPRAAPTPVQLTLKLSDTVERLAVTGEVQLDPDRFACGLGIEGRGLRGGALAAYLPPGLQLALDDGELLGRLEAGSGPAEGGGRTLRLRVQNLSLRNGSSSLLELPELAVVVPRFDPAARAYHVSQCRLDGLRATVTTLADGLEVAGLRLSPPARPEVAATGPGAPPVRVAAPTVRSLPELRLEGLDVQAAGIRIVDGTRADAEPLDVSLRLTTTPWHGTVDDGAPAAPLEVRLTAAAAPLLRTATLDLTLHPLLAEPRIEGKLEAQGIDTTAVLRVRPGLADRLAGDVQEGTLGLRFLAEFDLHRSRRDEFPFGMPFAVHTEVHDVALRGTPDGPLLAGLEHFSCDVPMFDPRTGDVRAQTIDVQTPALHLVRQQDGLHALGFVLRKDAAPAEAKAPEEPVPPEPRTRPVFAAAEILVSGIDFRYTNTISSPPTELPLDDLDLVIARFSTAGLREPLPFRFELSLGGADIELPVPQRNSSFLTGIFNTAASAVGVGGDKQVMAQQPWFDALHVDGQLQLFPAPQGHVRVSLGSFDLRCLSRLAEGAGADIHDGILDAGVKVELRGEQGTSVQSQFVFTHLSMSEPAGGPVSTYLKLPVSLDTMLYVLRNDQDEQRVPLSFEIHKGEVSGEVIAAKAVTALGAVLADAIAKSPLRVAGVFTGLLGLGGGSEDLGKRAASLTFVPGDASLPADLQAQLQSLVAFAAGDKGITLVLKHDLGGADLERLQVLANPPAADAAALAARLRQELAVSNKERTALAATVEAQIAAGRTYQSRESRARLQAIDRASGTKADALDAALQLLRPDRERRDDARTRAAAQQLATARLRALELWLAGKLGPGGELRVEVRTPRFTAAAPPAGPGGGTITIVPVRRQRS